MLENYISLYNATLQYAWNLLTVCRSSFHQFENSNWLNDFPCCWKTVSHYTYKFPMLENCVLGVWKFSTRWQIGFDLANLHFMETNISWYTINLPYDGKLLTVFQSSFHKFKDWHWLNDCPIVGTLYLIITEIFDMLENCVLWVCKFWIRLKIGFD